MMRSMLADQPYSPVTSTHGDSVTRSDITTFSTLRPSLVTETSFLPSYSLSCCTQYSSIGSVMKMTSKLRFLQRSMNGDVSTAFFVSPVM